MAITTSSSTRVNAVLPDAASAPGEGFHDLIQLLHDVRTDHDERAAIRESLEHGLGKLPAGVRSKSGLDDLAPEQFERILADAEALLLHHLTTEQVQP